MEPLTFVNGIGEVAMRYGVEESILLHTIVYWVRENRSKGENFRDGRWWTYNSVRGLAEIFPWWTEKQVRRIVNSCVEQGALIVGNYNKDGRDRTVWYSPGDKLFLMYGETHSVKSICPNGQMHSTKRADASAQMGEPLPCSNSCNNTPLTPQGDSGGDGTKKRKRKRNATTPQYKPEWFERFWAKYPPRDGRKDHRKEAIAAWDKLQPSLELCHAMSKALDPKNWPRRWFDENGRYIPLASTWINGRRWEVEYAEQPTKPPDDLPTALPPRTSHQTEINGEQVIVFG